MEDTKIYLIYCELAEEDSLGIPTGVKRTVISHGVGNNTLKNYVLPEEIVGPTYNDDAGQYILY